MPKSEIVCDYCGKWFIRTNKEINRNKKLRLHNYCSKQCQFATRTRSSMVICKQCGKEFRKLLNQIKKFPNHFCGSSCAATYNNTHKTKGTRRSKIEVWIEQQLTQKYPDLKILYNDKLTINAELDIYIPSLGLAFELNGIFHYEPIFGSEKLANIQTNDKRRFQACLEHNIELCIIDTSKIEYFTIKSSAPILNIITKIIDAKTSNLQSESAHHWTS